MVGADGDQAQSVGAGQAGLEALRREHHKQGLQRATTSRRPARPRGEPSAIESATAEFKSLGAKRQMEVQKAMEDKLRESGFATEALQRRQIDE